ncbi:hypothetical protein B0O80DRAFT_66676 [Mortierella sp. GBAus27b]|nr:hypothetical protein B0O80DRAFT_66676 [Mortierella sp. GBAus27b]
MARETLSMPLTHALFFGSLCSECLSQTNGLDTRGQTMFHCVLSLSLSTVTRFRFVLIREGRVRAHLTPSPFCSIWLIRRRYCIDQRKSVLGESGANPNRKKAKKRLVWPATIEHDKPRPKNREIAGENHGYAAVPFRHLFTKVLCFFNRLLG